MVRSTPHPRKDDWGALGINLQQIADWTKAYIVLLFVNSYADGYPASVMLVL